MNFYILCLPTFFLCFCESLCFSQAIFSKVKYNIESGVQISTSSQTPFWLRSNQYGIVPLESQFLTMRGAGHKEYDSTKNEQYKSKKFGYGYGLSFAANIGKKSSFFLPEAYMKVRYGAFEIYGGRRREIVGLVDTTLTSGSYIWSGNALPMPKIQISIPNYMSIIGKGLLSVKGGFTHGWFDNGYVKNYYLHQKWFYGRIGKSSWKLYFYGGFNHQVQWGGKYAIPQKDPNGLIISSLPSNFNSYLYVISGISINKEDNGTSTGRPLNEQFNRIGNHLGTIDIGLETKLSNFTLFLYRQSIYDDGSLFYLSNISDGLLGVSINNIKSTRNLGQFHISKILFEYFNTMNQGGRGSAENTIPQLRGLDNYFNNSVYLNGWSYQDKSIGTPFFNTKKELKLTDSDIVNFRNTRLIAYIFSLHGQYKKLYGDIKFSKSINYGTYFSPLKFNRNNLFLDIRYRILDKQELSYKIDFENNNYSKNAFGIFFSWKKYY